MFTTDAKPWTSHDCPADCDRTYTNSGHLGGWSSDHNGRCPHGTYVAGSGVDWICGYCENGEPVQTGESEPYGGATPETF